MIYFISFDNMSLSDHNIRMIYTLIKKENLDIKFYHLFDFIDVCKISLSGTYLQKRKKIAYFYIPEVISNIQKKISKDSIIICSCAGYLDFSYCLELSKLGYKVIVGGSFVNSFFDSLSKIRNYINSENLIFLRGYLNYNLSFKEIILRFKDIDIGFKFDIDLYLESLKILDPVFCKGRKNLFGKKFQCVSIVTTVGCEYNLCRFCLSKNCGNSQKEVIFSSGDEFKYFLENLLSLYQTRNLCIHDPELELVTLELLGNIKGVELLYAMINPTNLLDQKYLELLDIFLRHNRIYSLFIATDCFNDDGLEFLKRPYKLVTIHKGLRNIMNLKNINNIYVTRLSVLNDIPFQNESIIIDSYKEALSIFAWINNLTKKTSSLDNLKFYLESHPFMLFPDLDFSSTIVDSNVENSHGVYRFLRENFKLEYIKSVPFYKNNLIIPYRKRFIERSDNKILYDLLLQYNIEPKEFFKYFT